MIDSEDENNARDEAEDNKHRICLDGAFECLSRMARRTLCQLSINERLRMSAETFKPVRCRIEFGVTTKGRAETWRVMKHGMQRTISESDSGA